MSSTKRRLPVEDAVVLSTPKKLASSSKDASPSPASVLKKARQSPAKKALFSPGKTASAPSTPSLQTTTPRESKKLVSPTPVKSSASSSSAVSSSSSSSAHSSAFPSSIFLEAEEEQKEQHIPVYIHRNVGYKAKGTEDSEAGLAFGQKKALGVITQKCVIPQDFESSRSYGPLSGVSWGQRVLSCFQAGIIKSKGGRELVLCISCGNEGHFKKECDN